MYKKIWIGRAAWKKKYLRYLQSPAWKAIRQLKLTDAGHQCVQCLSKRSLQVHHLTYERLFHENLSDLMVLCRSCHQAKHPDKRWLRKEKGKYQHGAKPR